MKQSISALFFVLIAAALAPAQDISGSISGIVTDETGAVVPNATVTAVNTATSARFTAKSDGEGQYAIRTIPVGIYDLLAEAPGFRKYEAKAIRLQSERDCASRSAAERQLDNGNRDRDR
jgi:hypothetical protein